MALKLWNAILTGSRAYGTPCLTSDLDIVMRMSHEDVRMLKAAYPEFNAGKDYGDSDTTIFQFGQNGLNLICVTDDETFTEWVEGTVDLLKDAPVDRETAVEHFKGIRARNSNKPHIDSVDTDTKEPHTHSCQANLVGCEGVATCYGACNLRQVCASCDIPF